MGAAAHSVAKCQNHHRMKETTTVATATTMTSLEIAEVTGKRHDAILRDIRKLLEQGVNQHNFVLVDYTDAKGEKRPCYTLTKKGCLILASGYNAKLREAIIYRWEELETSRPDHSELVLRLARSLYAANKMIASLHEAFSMEHEASLIILNGVRGGDSTQCKLDFIIKCVWQLVGYYLDPIDTERKMDQSRLREIIDSLSAGKEVSDEEDSLPF